MSMTELKVSFPTEKLDALRFFMDKKQQTVEQELKDYLDKTYEKLVPAQVREYVESRMEQTPAQQPEPEQAPAARERPARQTRRQREQAAAEQSLAPEAPTEAEGPAEQENQGMTISM
jgi:hypothetical protein